MGVGFSAPVDIIMQFVFLSPLFLFFLFQVGSLLGGAGTHDPEIET